MTRVTRCAAVAAMVAASALVSSALANTITFETAPLDQGFTGPVTEDGFTYSTLSGGLFVNGFGNPGQDMEPETVGGGVLKIVSATGGDFDFNALDYSVWSISGTGSQTLVVKGLLGASTVGMDTYTLPGTSMSRTLTGRRNSHPYWPARPSPSSISPWPPESLLLLKTSTMLC